MCTTRFLNNLHQVRYWNNLHQVRSRQNTGKPKDLKFLGSKKQKGLSDKENTTAFLANKTDIYDQNIVRAPLDSRSLLPQSAYQNDISID